MQVFCLSQRLSVLCIAACCNEPNSLHARILFVLKPRVTLTRALLRNTFQQLCALAVRSNVRVTSDSITAQQSRTTSTKKCSRQDACCTCVALSCYAGRYASATEIPCCSLQWQCSSTCGAAAQLLLPIVASLHWSEAAVNLAQALSRPNHYWSHYYYLLLAAALQRGML
jgi:hypothetical protein